LLIRPGAIGDFIVSLPALESLRGGYTEVWSAGPNCALARFADRARSIASTGLDRLGIDGVEAPAALLETLSSFDVIVSWYGSNRPEFRSASAPFPFHFLPALPPSGCACHATDFYLEQARSLGGGGVDPVPRIRCDVQRADFAVIHPFSGSPAKNWPLPRFRELAGRLPRVLWCAGPEEDLPGAVRFDDLYELARWLASAHVYIGNDSGISHLAAAVGAPTVALFGPSNPAIWAPRGERVSVIQATSGEAAFEGIALQRVLDAIESIL
jgi:heptosyltransferase III